MFTFRRLALGLVVACLVAAPALAQQPRGGFGGGAGMGATQLIGQKSVQEELKIGEDQLAKIKEFQEKARTAGQGLRDLSQEERRTKMAEINKNNEKMLGEILKPEQAKRLKQIALQQTEKTAGMSAALRDASAAEALKLTDDQKELLKAIGEDQQKMMREAFQGGGGGNFEEARKKMEDFRKTANEKIAKTLSADQKTAWTALVGEEFKGKIELPMRRPGGGGR